MAFLITFGLGSNDDGSESALLTTQGLGAVDDSIPDAVLVMVRAIDARTVEAIFRAPVNDQALVLVNYEINPDIDLYSVAKVGPVTYSITTSVLEEDQPYELNVFHVEVV